MILTVSLMANPTPNGTGWTSRYDPGLMEMSAEYHGIDLSLYDGGIAALSCDDIGEEWLIRPLGAEEWKHVVVVDCAGDESSFIWMSSRNIIVELQYEMAEEWGALRGGIEVEVVRP